MKTKQKTFSLASVAGAAVAPAAIIHTSLEVPLTASTTSDSIFFSLSEQWATTTNQTLGGEVFRLYFYDNGTNKPVLFNQNTSGEIALLDDYAKRFSTEDLISGSENFTNELTYINISGNNDANWAPGTRGFLGLMFNNEGTPNFGWADFEYRENSSMVLHSFAYDDSGAPIPAGAVPEPQTVMLAILAAGSLYMMERRRRAAQADA
ncbi:MAG: hypothetical protein JJU05_05950 [Verrucomicrobia bacterium]|nr:hypothetical protein [Verrucomicrobiota bacterium]MCH8525684.1 hypothetical protein [Kiritimatiellia bacterium]